MMANSTQHGHAVMAIDLGAEFLKLALIKPGVPMEIVLNRESARKTPFALTIKEGERFFGSEALKKGVAATRNTYTFFLDLVGKQYTDLAVANYQKRFTYLLLKQNDQRGTVNFATDSGDIPAETMLAMVLANARSEVEAYAGQPVHDAVICVPAHFGLMERQAVEAAAQIAGINLLQQLSAGAAAGLNYGVFRYKDIVEQPQTLLIYDVGSTKIQTTVVQYRLSNESKENGPTAVPRMEVIGVGFNPELGGHHLTLKLRELLIDAFRKQHPRTDGDITSSPQAMAKLLREADRVKQVLSANAETFAQVECLFQDLDFRAKCTRQELEEIFQAFEPAFLAPIKAAMQMAQLPMEKLERILLMGASTRVPRVQELLGHFFAGKELGRNLNTDEAIALGAIYQAARVSQKFIVKRFDVADSALPEQSVQLKPMNEQEIVLAKAMLFEFENREKAKVERAAALNSLESTVYGYSSKMDETDFTKFGTKEELELIAKLLSEFKEWLEDVPDETGADQLKEKRRELVKPIRKLKSRKRQKEERPEFIDKLSRVLDDAEKQAQTFRQTKGDFFTEAELDTFIQLINSTKGWFQQVQRELGGLADHHDATFTNDDLKSKATALSRELKMLSNKLKAAPTPAAKPKEEKADVENSSATNGGGGEQGNGGKAGTNAQQQQEANNKAENNSQGPTKDNGHQMEMD